MKNELTDEQVQEILKILDDALTKGPWEKSNFLRVIGKNLREIREKLAKQSLQVEENNKDIASAYFLKHQGMQEVFITIYSNEGTNIQSWERIINNLPRQVISRPIYAAEEDAHYMIKSKENKHNEGYVAVFIDPTDILIMSDEKIAKDKFGKCLMNLKDKAVKLENISRFVHVSGSYSYSKGRLIKLEAS